MDEVETPQSFRAGCTVALGMSVPVHDTGLIMKHIEWLGKAVLSITLECQF